MDWSNEKALELLELLKTEPCLWDPAHNSHKNRWAVRDAWQRIMKSLSYSISYEEMRKKKESLLGYYRVHLNNYKKSLKFSADENDVYRTNWFAFDLMDSFLRPIYINKPLPSTPSSLTSDDTTTDSTEIPKNITIADTSSSSIICSKIEYEDPHVQYQTSIEPSEAISTKIMDCALDCLKSIAESQKRELLDEYDHFALMIASKIRKIQNIDDREVLMNSIQNLTFEFLMKIKKSTATENLPTESPSSPSTAPIKLEEWEQQI